MVIAIIRYVLLSSRQKRAHCSSTELVSNSVEDRRLEINRKRVGYGELVYFGYFR